MDPKFQKEPSRPPKQRPLNPPIPPRRLEEEEDKRRERLREIARLRLDERRRQREESKRLQQEASNSRLTARQKSRNLILAFRNNLIRTIDLKSETYPSLNQPHTTPLGFDALSVSRILIDFTDYQIDTKSLIKQIIALNFNISNAAQKTPDVDQLLENYYHAAIKQFGSDLNVVLSLLNEIQTKLRKQILKTKALETDNQLKHLLNSELTSNIEQLIEALKTQSQFLLSSCEELL
jgi:hypothetical protein